jgi:hypothetical protein
MRNFLILPKNIFLDVFWVNRGEASKNCVLNILMAKFMKVFGRVGVARQLPSLIIQKLFPLNTPKWALDTFF